MDTLKKNEEIARKFLKVEKALNSARTPSELLETLFRKLEAEFDIPYIWVSVVKREKDDLQTSLAMPRYLWERVGILDEGSFDTILPLKTAPVLANENLRPFYKLFPENRKFFLKSIAVVPLTLHGEFRGSLNLGDASPERYSAGMDTSLLQHLAEKVSERLDGMLHSREEALSRTGTGVSDSSPDAGVSESE